MLRFWGQSGRTGEARYQGRTRRRSRRPAAEGLEARALLTVVPGTDYALSGFRWADPSRITYSIAPDGVGWDHGDNILQATFDARFGSGNWERELARALATWESVANINVVRVGDSPLDFDWPGRTQGDPRFGDIRFGGYAFLNHDTTTLARTYFPPPNGTTAAGDVEINTTMNFQIGSDYDLYSVMLHETGHALGLEHATNPNDIMYFRYQGLRDGLSPGDIAGIQALYGPRVADAYQQQGQALGFASALDVTARLDATHQSVLSDTSLATIGDTEYFSVVAPDLPGATLQVSAAAWNISLLSPQVSLYDGAGRLLDVAGSPGSWGDDVTVQTSQVVPGQRYYIAVTGATRDAFAVGSYHLLVGFEGGSLPTPVPPVTPAPFPPIPPPTPLPLSPTPPLVTAPSPAPIATATPDVAAVALPAPPVAPDSSEPNNTLAQATPLGTILTTYVGGRSLHTASDVDDFSFRAARAGVYQVIAAGTSIRVLDAAGRPIASGLGQVSFRSPRARRPYTVEISAPGSVPVATYSLAIAPQAPQRPVRLPGVVHGMRRRGLLIARHSRHVLFHD